jgi:hypothetical protein
VRHFLLVYDRAAGKLVDCREFDDYSDALATRFELERGKANAGEIVVLSAESRENLERTHARYFKSASQLAASA